MKNGKCPAGEYYCYTNKECKPIPAGFMVDPEGMLRKENGASTTNEEWSEKYKKSVNCKNPKGFSQRAHCQGRKKKMKESKDHEVAMAQSQLKNIEKNVKSLKKKLGTKEKDIPAWMQDKISKTHHNMAAVGEYHEEQVVNEEGLRDWFGKSKSKDGKKGWVNVVTGDSCASDKPGEGIPKCVSSAKRASMSKKERLAAAAAKRREDPGQQSKSGAAKPTNVKTDRKVRKEEMELCPVCGFDPCQCLEGTVTEAKDKKGKSSGKKDACYHKVKSRYDVWPSAYASGALVKCRKVGAANWGNKSESFNNLSPISQKVLNELSLGDIFRGMGLPGPFLKPEERAKINQALRNRVNQTQNTGKDVIAPLTTGGNTRYVIQKPGDPTKDPSIKDSRREINPLDPNIAARMSRLEKGSPEIVDKSAAARRSQQAAIAAKSKPQVITTKQNIDPNKRGPFAPVGSQSNPSPVAPKPKPEPVVARSVPVVAKPKVNPFPTRDSIKPKTPNPLMSATPPKSKMTYKTPNPLMSANPPKSKMTYKTPNPLMDKTFGYQTGNAPDQRLSRLQNSYTPNGKLVDERYVGSGHQPPVGWKSYGGYEKEPVPEVDATWKKIEDIRKSIPVKKASTNKTTQVAHFEPEGEQINEKCWTGYTQKGMKKKGKRMVPNCVPVSEDMTRINQNGQTYSVILMWRGRTYTFQMFIPTMRRPAKQDIEREVRKVYPDARVLTFMPKQYDPTDPTIIIPEAYDSRNPLDKGNPDNTLRRAVQRMGEDPKNVIPSKLQKSHFEPEGEVIDEKKMTEGEMDKEKKLRKKYDKGGMKASMKKQYGKEEGEKIYFATIRKKAMESVQLESAAWTRKEGKNKSGGLNEKGRKSYERENPGSDLKAPSKKVGNKRRASFCARMKGMKKKLTSKKTASDPNSRINKSLRAWNC